MNAFLRIAVPGPAHPSHPIPPFIKPPEPIDDPNPIPLPDDDDPDPESHQPIKDPNRGVKQPPPVYAAMH